MKKIVISLSFIFFISTGILSGANKTVLDYFPLEIGNWWIYIAPKTGKNVNKLEVLNTGDYYILKNSMINFSLTTIFLYSYDNGELIKKRATISLGSQKTIKNLDEIVLKEPIITGTKWETDEYDYKIVSTDETIKVKAGIFKHCIKIESFNKSLYNMGSPKKYCISYTYYAPDVGHILTEMKSGSRVTELAEYKINH